MAMSVLSPLFNHHSSLPQALILTLAAPLHTDHYDAFVSLSSPFHTRVHCPYRLTSSSCRPVLVDNRLLTGSPVRHHDWLAEPFCYEAPHSLVIVLSDSI
ncbi:hypothetical protein F5148DRAFT_993858 [Russula earlei]|uniref:Uncharacterized protein n=1 Tax=Russula earlei TaxID=71964 RepID=A0ACC0UIH9_9AGAM|nr:hypothetical protein F5148DRAFT_993858 [Russula earlei]